MAQYLLFGATFAFAAVAQPGPFQAYLVSQALSIGWRRTLPAVFAPLVSDAPIAIVVLIVLSRLPLTLQYGLRVVGGIFLLYLAARAFRSWRHYDEPQTAPPQSARRTLLDASIVNVLNPNAWIGWSLVLGPLLLQGWREAPAHGIALLASFYSLLVGGTTAIVLIVASAKRLGSRITRALVGVSGIALAAFGAYQLWSGIARLIP
ncbi:MAG TPA: LysE family transporter [Thermoanaerobaculia bacterium]|nr:LysE family transporter [Thermoanaerobaculia bacterium]